MTKSGTKNSYPTADDNLDDPRTKRLKRRQTDTLTPAGMVNVVVVEWMQPKLSTLLADSIHDRKNLSQFPPKYVQVLSANNDDRFLIASDGCNTMTVMLTTK